MTGVSIQRAALKGSDGTVLLCQFNPTTVRLRKSASWTAHPARGSRDEPRPHFVGTGPQELSARLLFDAFDSLGGPAMPVHTAIDQLLEWTRVPVESLHSKTPQPPAVTFSWGSTKPFTGFLKQVNAEYLMFDPDGLPLRATADITIQRIPDQPAGTNPTSGGISGRRSTSLGECDSLATVAYAEYGDPGLWRAIARANGIEDPARVAAGTTLLVPPRSQAARLSRSDGDGDAGR